MNLADAAWFTGGGWAVGTGVSTRWGNGRVGPAGLAPSTRPVNLAMRREYDTLWAHAAWDETCHRPDEATGYIFQ
ncbi:hypothetical protein [Crateriforma conspicua]|uniref:hypothetical protein n=1 Tax=Crateriforma conspicua TaxID=2527996 RepID=UPI00118A9789|nr:hypothetical protein [Crateriforma conspicua]QDV63592.1 hypothetical protein Mal65_27370 [Crateriforma conspicua]